MRACLGLLAFAATSFVEDVAAFTGNGLLRAVFRQSTAYSHKVSWPSTTPDAKKIDLMHHFEKIAQKPGKVAEEAALPDYYLRAFHCYDNGNLGWEAALEADAANDAVLGGRDAAEKVRTFFSDAVKGYCETTRGVRIPARNAELLDVGCSTGISADYLARLAPRGGRVTGVDLSPHFLAVAQASRPQHHYVRAVAEALPFADSAFDCAQISFVLHETPTAAAEAIVREAARVVRPGGILCILDLSPRVRASSPMMQFIFDRTEPHMHEHPRTCEQLTSFMENSGVKDVKRLGVPPKHAGWVGRKTVASAF